MHRFIELYKEGGSASYVMEKIKEVRKRHRRTPMLLEKRAFVPYNRGRGLQLNFSDKGSEVGDLSQEEEEEEEENAEAEAEAAEELEYAEEAITMAVKAFIIEKTGEKPFELQHFFLSDLEDWFADKGYSSGRLLVNLQQHIDMFDRFSREGDNCWIEKYESSDEDGDEEKDEEEDEEENEEEGEHDPDVIKGGLWHLVKSFLRSSTGEEPHERQHFLISDLEEWLRGARQAETTVDRMRELINQYTDIFSTKDDNVWIEHLCPPQAQNAFGRLATEEGID